MTTPTPGTHRDTLLIIIAVLLGLLVLGGTVFGFYYLGRTQPTASKATSNTGGIPAATAQSASTDTSGGSTGDTSSGQSVQSLLDGLKGSGGTFDSSKVDSTLSSLLGSSGTNVATTLSLVSEDQVKKNNQSGKDAVKTYLITVTAIVSGSQTSTLSENAISQIFNGDTSALTSESQKNQAIATKLAAVATPNEAVTLQREYLTLFQTSVSVLNGEAAMLANGSVDYTVLGQAEGLVNLSKQVDTDTATLKQQFGL